MTEREAIAIIERKSSIPMKNESFDTICEAYDIAIKALEKQVPKKPIDKLMYIECPSCENVGIEDCNYCPECGQRLDWSEV